MASTRTIRRIKKDRRLREKRIGRGHGGGAEVMSNREGIKKVSYFIASYDCQSKENGGAIYRDQRTAVEAKSFLPPSRLPLFFAQLDVRTSMRNH